MSLQATQIILRPVISEKSMDQSTVNKYTFAVADEANKMQIKDVDDLALEETKTRQLLGHLQSLGAAGKVLVVEDGKNEALELSARNVPDLVVIRADSLNIVDVLDADAIVITAPSVPTMSEVYA